MTKKLFALLIVLCLCVGVLSVTAVPAAAAGAAKAGNAYEVGYAKVDINPYWHEWVEWSKDTTNDIPEGIRGTIPYTDYYDEYDMLPLPMGGYGNNAYRLSRPKLMDDNGSGVGASTTNVTNTSRYYLKSDGTYATATSAGHYTALYKRSGNIFSGYTYTKDTDYQDVHLSSNRYTKDFAAQMGVTYADGVYGENDGDGVWATCVLVKDPQSNSPLLMIAVDNLGVDNTLTGLIKETILAQPEVQAIGLTEDRILINSNHTHGSVALGTDYKSTDTETTYTLAEGTFADESYTFTSQQLFWYLNFYKNYLREQLADAAVQAIADMEVAQTMEKGTIDTSLQTGYQLNGVRHNVQTYYGDDEKPEITYVRGSSFNNDMNEDGDNDSHMASTNYSASTPVSESDDSLHILKFTFANKEPIAMVNFRAHSTANNKQAAKLLHYNISSDWVSPLRYQLEQNGYRFSLLYGSSGNLGTGVSSDENSVIPHSYANYNTTLKRWELPATPYGKQIAQAALALLGDVAEKNNAITLDMTEVTMGKIQSLRSDFLLKKQEWSPLAYAAALAFYNAGSPTYGGRYTIADGETVSYTNSSGKTSSITLGEGEGGTFVVASVYHANNIKAKYESKANLHIELNAILLGNQVAFATVPVEASDRYSSKEIAGDDQIITNGVSNYNENDWDKLIGDSWGTPFVMSLTNGSHGYVPNQLAYDYGKSYTGTDYMVAKGSYESHTTWADRGAGEQMVDTLSNMLRSVEPRIADCPVCGKDQQWYPLSTAYFDEANSHNLTGGHYYLASDFDYESYARISEGTTVCMDLNGFTYSAESYSAASRAFNLYGTLNLFDFSDAQTGKMQGYGVKWATSTEFSAGTITVGNGGTLNLYSGSLTMNHVDGYGPYHGGVVSVNSNSTFNMYGGSVYGGVAYNGKQDATECNGGNIYIAGSNAKFNMYGGRIYGGTAYNKGGNLYISSGTANLLGGTMEGGNAASGGNIYAAGATVVIDGTTVTGGTATENGGSLYVAGGTVKLQSGTLGGGTAVNGGSVYLPEGATLAVAANSAISGGEADNGGCVYLAGGTLALADGATVSGGEAVNGGNVYAAGGNLNMTGSAAVSGGTATQGGNLYVAEETSFTLSTGTLTGGTAPKGGNVYVPDDAEFILDGATVTAGTATSNGGNVFVEDKAVFTMNSGDLTNGTTGGANNTSGGNVYTAGTFNLNGGSITGGTAYYGGNVQVQNSTAYFNMAGGTISGGTSTYGSAVANLCTSTGSHFRLAGGYIAGTAFVQGYVTLAGTTDGATPIRLSVKNAHNNLTVEGVYTGKITLVFNGNTYALGDKIGNADNANIASAQISSASHSDLSIAVAGNELRLDVPHGTVAKLGGTYFDNFADAFAAFEDASAPVVLMADADLGTLPKNVAVDLNGYDVTAVATNGCTLTVLDSATADFDSPDADSYGTVPAVTGIQAADGYMDITQGGKTSFHKYEMELQFVNISPSRKGISYTTTFKGDQVVKAQVKEFGIAMRLYAAPNATTVWADADHLTHIALSQSQWQTGDNAQAVKSVYIKNIIDWDVSDEENLQRAAIDIYGRSYIQLQNGQMIFSTAVPFSMQSAMEEADRLWESLTDEGREALVEMYLNPENHSFMQQWDLINIKIAAGEVSLDIGV